MWDIIIALVLVGFNISAFLLLNRHQKIKVNKQQLLVLLSILLVVAVIFIYKNPERYLTAFYMSAALFFLMGFRFVIYKVLSLPPKDEDKRRKMVRNFFDSALIPFFVIFFSIAQCVFIFGFNHS